MHVWSYQQKTNWNVKTLFMIIIDIQTVACLTHVGWGWNTRPLITHEDCLTNKYCRHSIIWLWFTLLLFLLKSKKENSSPTSKRICFYISQAMVCRIDQILHIYVKNCLLTREMLPVYFHPPQTTSQPLGIPKKKAIKNGSFINQREEKPTIILITINLLEKRQRFSRFQPQGGNEIFAFLKWKIFTLLAKCFIFHSYEFWDEILLGMMI